MNSVLGYDELVPRPLMRRVVLRLVIESKTKEIRALGLVRVLFKVALSLGFEDVFSRHWHFLSFALSFKVEAGKGMGEVLQARSALRHFHILLF